MKGFTAIYYRDTAHQGRDFEFGFSRNLLTKYQSVPKTFISCTTIHILNTSSFILPLTLLSLLYDHFTRIKLFSSQSCNKKNAHCLLINFVITYSLQIDFLSTSVNPLYYTSTVPTLTIFTQL